MFSLSIFSPLGPEHRPGAVVFPGLFFEEAERPPGVRRGCPDSRKVMTLIGMGQCDIRKVMTLMGMGQCDIRKVMTLIGMGQCDTTTTTAAYSDTPLRLRRRQGQRKGLAGRGSPEASRGNEK